MARGFVKIKLNYHNQIKYQLYMHASAFGHSPSSVVPYFSAFGIPHNLTSLNTFLTLAL